MVLEKYWKHIKELMEYWKLKAIQCLLPSNSLSLGQCKYLEHVGSSTSTHAPINNKIGKDGMDEEDQDLEVEDEDLDQDAAQTQVIGACYGVNGNNLPSKQEVVDLYKSKGIPRMCIYSQDEATLQALRGSNIELMMDVAGETLQSLTDPNVATDWVHRYVTSYSQDVNSSTLLLEMKFTPITMLPRTFYVP
ncbi:hypothetical protein JHK87_044970 [Glycine soja]|nr:hypothetical protein JHK87_044970 [Glycine soja]